MPAVSERLFEVGTREKNSINIYIYILIITGVQAYGCNVGAINTISVRDTAMNMSFTLTKWYKYYS